MAATKGESFAEEVVRALESAGICGAQIECASYDEKAFGNGVVVIGLGAIRLRVSRDRGQDSLDIALCSTPDSYYEFVDMEAALGWKTVIEAMQAPYEPLTAVFKRLSGRLDEVRDAVCGQRESVTRARLALVGEERERLFRARYRQ